MCQKKFLTRSGSIPFAINGVSVLRKWCKTVCSACIAYSVSVFRNGAKQSIRLGSVVRSVFKFLLSHYTAYTIAREVEGLAAGKLAAD